MGEVNVIDELAGCEPMPVRAIGQIYEPVPLVPTGTLLLITPTSVPAFCNAILTEVPGLPV